MSTQLGRHNEDTQVDISLRLILMCSFKWYHTIRLCGHECGWLHGVENSSLGVNYMQLQKRSNNIVLIGIESYDGSLKIR